MTYTFEKGYSDPRIELTDTSVFSYTGKSFHDVSGTV